MSNEAPSQRPSASAPKLPAWLILIIILGVMGFSWWQNQHTASIGPETANSEQPLLLKDLSPKSNQAFTDPSSVPEEDEPTLPTVAPDSEIVDSNALDPSSANQTPPAADRSSKTEPSGPNSPRPPPVDRTGERRTAEKTGKPSTRLDPAPPSPQLPNSGSSSNPRAKPTTPSQSNSPKSTKTERSSPQADEAAYQVPNQTIRNLSGRVVYKGTIDLKPTLDRIERGEENRHRNDGSTFQNRENRLPRKPSGYYKEYVHPTPGENGPGPQRIIIGKEGEVWYTADHYKTFKKIK